MDRLARLINALVIVAISLVLYMTLSIEWNLHLAPCPFCYIQRLALVGIGTAELLNLRFGFRISHFILCFFSALAGLIAASWQIKLHQGIGILRTPSIFSLPLYVWSFIVLLTLSCVLGILLVFRGHKRSPPSLGLLPIIAFFALFLAICAHVIGTYIQCGLTFC